MAFQGIYSWYHGSVLINLNVLLSKFSPIICQVATYRKIETKENFKLIALKVVTFDYEKLGNFCYFGKLIAQVRWSQLEVPLDMYFNQLLLEVPC